MVGPSISDDERKTFLRRLRVGFALFVGISMGLVVYHGDGEMVVLGGAVVAGTAIGGVLAWWVFPDSIERSPFDR